MVDLKFHRTLPLLLIFLWTNTYAEEGILELSVNDIRDQAIEGIRIGFQGPGATSAPTTARGKTRLPLAEGIRPGATVHLQLIQSDLATPWVFIDPWDQRVEVHRFDDPSAFIQLVLAQRQDRDLLTHPDAIKSITENILSELKQQRPADEALSEQHRQAVLQEQAQKYGLEVNDIDQAIRAWQQKIEDPYDLGLAALYDRNYPESTRQLKESLAMREKALESAQADVFDAAFFLGQSLYEEGKYAESAEAYRRADELRPDDSLVLNAYATSLQSSGSYREAEPRYQRALAISEKALGPDHPNVAATLNNLAGMYQSQGR